jgi:hypothetical protein
MWGVKRLEGMTETKWDRITEDGRKGCNEERKEEKKGKVKKEVGK